MAKRPTNAEQAERFKTVWNWFAREGTADAAGGMQYEYCFAAWRLAHYPEPLMFFILGFLAHEDIPPGSAADLAREPPNGPGS